MEIDTQQTVRRINYALLTFCLLLMAAGLTAVVWITTHAYASAEEPTRRLLFHLAWVAAATLGLTLLVLLWIVLRWGRLRIKPPIPLPETHYVDAWSEAGKRIRVDEAFDEDDEDDEDEGEQGRWRT